MTTQDSNQTSSKEKPSSDQAQQTDSQPQPDTQEQAQEQSSKSMLALLILLLGIGGPIVYMLNTRSDTGDGQGMPNIDIAQYFNVEKINLDVASVGFDGGLGPDGTPSLRTEKAQKPQGSADSKQEGVMAAKIVPAAGYTAIPVKESVIGVVVNGQARAYPIRILNWHEVVNDTLGGIPIAVIYCPQSNSVTVVDRRISGKTLEFGLTGLFLNNNAILYDRTDKALWPQLTFTAASGPLVGQSLKPINTWTVSFLGAWLKLYPQSTMLSLDTGYYRRYDRSPYMQYMQDQTIKYPVHEVDQRLMPKTTVIGVKLGDVVKAYPLVEVAKQKNGTFEDQINGQTIRIHVGVKTGAIQILQAPKDAYIAMSFWFAWAATYPQCKLGLKGKTVAQVASEQTASKK